MPRYYFDLYDEDGLTVDLEGMVLSDIEAAQEEAARTLADMARDEIRKRIRHQPQNHSMAIEIRDDSGSIVQLKFIFTIAHEKVSRVNNV